MFKKIKQLFCHHDWCIENHRELIPLNRPVIYQRDGLNVIEEFKDEQ